MVRVLQVRFCPCSAPSCNKTGPRPLAMEEEEEEEEVVEEQEEEVVETPRGNDRPLLLRRGSWRF